MKKENTILFAGASEVDIAQTKISLSMPFGNSGKSILPQRKYNRVIIKSSDGSGRNVIGFVKQIRAFDKTDKNQYWMQKRCKVSLNWNGIIEFDKIAEVSDATLKLISDTMTPIKKSNGVIGYRGRMSGGSFGYCNSTFQNI